MFLDSRLPDRFWSKCVPEPNSGCWLWIGAQDSNGYGSFKFDKAKQFLIDARMDWYYSQKQIDDSAWAGFSKP